MGDDWRVELKVERGGGVHRVTGARREHRVARDARARLGPSVVVTVDGATLFAYADDGDGAREAAAVLEEFAADQDLTASVQIERWHEDEEAWRSPEVPLPATAEERQAARDRSEARELAEAANGGAPRWEVRIDPPTRAQTKALATTLREEGLQVAGHATYLLIGCATEAEAGRLADRIRAEVPAGTRVLAEGSEAFVAGTVRRSSRLRRPTP